MSETPQILLAHHLKKLKLPTFLPSLPTSLRHRPPLELL